MSATPMDDLVLALVDLSGSMAGQSAATVRAQIQELCAELISAEPYARNEIRFGILGFHETAEWLVPTQDVKAITGLPLLQIQKDAAGFYRASSFVALLDKLCSDLNGKMLCGARPIRTLHLILFSDLLPTDAEAPLRDALARFEQLPICAHRQFYRYLVCDPSSRKAQFRKDWLQKGFLGENGSTADPSSFSALVGQICTVINNNSQVDFQF